MAAIVKSMLGLYHTVFIEWRDSRTDDMFLLKSPFPVIVLLGCYLYFVQNLGQRWMKDRKAMDLKLIMIIYNAIQVLLCTYVAYKALDLAWARSYKWICEPVDFYNSNSNAVDILKTTHLYFLIKLTDLLDTVFFVLKKKNSHISFLHVYHHTGMVVLSWSATKFLGGGHGTFLGLINSMVHIVMYAYYLLTLVNDEYKNSISFKKKITQLQIIQFMMLVIHFSTLVFVPNCGYPRWVAAVMVPQNLFMMILFLDFYRNAYIKRDSQDAKIKFEHDSNLHLSNGKYKDS